MLNNVATGNNNKRKLIIRSIKDSAENELAAVVLDSEIEVEVERLYGDGVAQPITSELIDDIRKKRIFIASEAIIEGESYSIQNLEVINGVRADLLIGSIIYPSVNVGSIFAVQNISYETDSLIAVEVYNNEALNLESTSTTKAFSAAFLNAKLDQKANNEGNYLGMTTPIAIVTAAEARHNLESQPINTVLRVCANADGLPPISTYGISFCWGANDHKVLFFYPSVGNTSLWTRTYFLTIGWQDWVKVS